MSVDCEMISMPSSLRSTANQESPGAATTARDATGRERTDMTMVVECAPEDIDQGDRLKKICMDDCLDVWLAIKAAGRQP